MFSFYGSKSKIVHLYPAPKHDRIIEPFAGSARYALRYWDREVLLCDPSTHVVEVWKYLIQASESDILSLPDVPSKISLDSFTQLSDAERWLIGFHLCRGKAKPRKVGHGLNSWSRDRERIASNLFKVRHWKVIQHCYCSIPNTEATWFIDAPYQATMAGPNKSDRYEHWAIDYDMLAAFAKNRKGQVIACEGDGADWLPFELLKMTNANTNAKSVKRSGEYIFVQEDGWQKRPRSILQDVFSEPCGLSVTSESENASDTRGSADVCAESSECMATGD